MNTITHRLKQKIINLKIFNKISKDNTANIKSDDETLVMNSKQINSLIYERNLFLLKKI